MNFIDFIKEKIPRADMGGYPLIVFTYEQLNELKSTLFEYPLIYPQGKYGEFPALIIIYVNPKYIEQYSFNSYHSKSFLNDYKEHTSKWIKSFEVLHNVYGKLKYFPLDIKVDKSYFK